MLPVYKLRLYELKKSVVTRIRHSPLYVVTTLLRLQCVLLIVLDVAREQGRRCFCLMLFFVFFLFLYFLFPLLFFYRLAPPCLIGRNKERERENKNKEGRRVKRERESWTSSKQSHSSSRASRTYDSHGRDPSTDHQSIKVCQSVVVEHQSSETPLQQFKSYSTTCVDGGQDCRNSRQCSRGTRGTTRFRDGRWLGRYIRGFYAQIRSQYLQQAWIGAQVRVSQAVSHFLNLPTPLA